MINVIKLFIISVLLISSNSMANSWKVEGLELNNQLNQLQLKIEKLELISQQIEISDIQYSCLSSQKLYPIHKCQKGSVKFSYDNIAYNLEISGWMDFFNNKWLLIISNKKKSISIELDSNDLHSINLSLIDVSLEDFVELTKSKLNIGDIEGKITSDIHISFNQQLSIFLNYNIQELYWESTDGDYVLANVFIEGQLELKEKDGLIQIDPEINLISGESLLKDTYVAFDQTPIQSKASILVQDNHFQKFQLNLLSNNIFTSSINIVEWQESLTPNRIYMDYSILDLDKFYKGFIASYFELLGVSNGKFSGQLKGGLIFMDGKVDHLITNIFEIEGAIPSKKIEINNLNGELNWIRSNEFNPSTLNWDNLILAGMPLQNSEIYFQSNHLIFMV